MFKGFTNRLAFHGFPEIIFQRNQTEAYGLTSLKHWFNAEDFNHLADLTAIDSWRDRLSGLVFSQPTAGNQPRFRTANPLFNNKPTVDFFSTSRWLTSTDLLATGNKFTIVAVCNAPVSSALSVVLGNTGNTTQFEATRDATGAAINLGGNFYQHPTARRLPRIIILTNLNIMCEGVLATTRTTDFPPVAFNQIATRQSTATWSLNGNIAELLFYDREANTNEMLAISNELNSKYAIY